jgi:hypothetical protein
MVRRTGAFVISALALCASTSTGETRRFGKPLQGLKPVALSDVLSNPADGKRVRLEGKVQAVCRNKGCWLELAQGKSAVHVTFEGYSFFLPRDAAGKQAAIEGRVVVKARPAGEVEHLEGEGASKAAASSVSIEASGVELGD